MVFNFPKLMILILKTEVEFVLVLNSTKYEKMKIPGSHLGIINFQ